MRALIRQPLVFPERVTLLQALEQFRHARTHFAFVVDEFGSVEGVVTLSDVMETIAGNLPNEGEEIDARYDIQPAEHGGWIANGHMPLEDLALYVALPLDERRNYHTLAGLLMDSLQHVPAEGEELRVGDYLLRTLQVENHRVQKSRLCRSRPHRLFNPVPGVIYYACPATCVAICSGAIYRACLTSAPFTLRNKLRRYSSVQRGVAARIIAR